MELLDDVCHMESRFGLFEDNVSFSARQVHSMYLIHHSLRNHFGRTCLYSQIKRLKWKLGSVCLEIVLKLMQDRSTVCKEHTICSKINLDAPNGTPRCRVSNVISLQSIQRHCWFQCKIGAQFAPNAPQSKKPFWTLLLVLLSEEAQVEAQFCLFGDRANLDATQLHSLHGTYQLLGNQFGRT